MSSRRQILVSHYSTLLRKVATWAGLVALLGTTLVASPAAALGTQMGARSVTPTTLLAANAGTSYAITFKVGTNGTIGSMQIQICDSPLESVACVASGTGGVNSNGADASAASYTSMTGTACTGGTWAAAAAVTPGPGVNGTARRLTNSGTAVSPTNANACTLTWGGIRNPTGNNQHFYLRLTTYSDTAYTTEVDFGGFALMTAQNLTVTASVQEALTFCVGDTTAADCTSTGAGAISLSTGSGCPVMSTANICTGTSQMTAYTNANTGYSITYNGTVFTGPSDTITAAGGTAAVSTPGAKQFGLNLTKVGAGSGAIGAQYNTAGSYAFVAATPTVVATAAAATATNTYTVTYGGNVDATTKPGLYSSTFNYVCTGLF